MKLTRTERWILYNQHRILAALLPREKEDHERACDVLMSGYEREYGKLVALDEELPETERLMVWNVFEMFRALQRAIDDDSTMFHGYSGNDETEHMAYARYVLKGKNFEDVRIAHEDLNYGPPMCDRYRAMLRAWNAHDDRDARGVQKKYRLTPEEARQILAVR